MVGSGFFDGDFMPASKQAGYGYLVKVKLKNLRRLLARQDWQSVPGKPRTFRVWDHEAIVDENETEAALFSKN